jgi:hypothetical protein
MAACLRVANAVLLAVLLSICSVVGQSSTDYGLFDGGASMDNTAPVLLQGAASALVSGTTSGKCSSWWRRGGNCGNCFPRFVSIYRYCPLAAGNVALTTCGAPFHYDTALGIYDSSNTGSYVSCNDDTTCPSCSPGTSSTECNRLSAASATVVAGRTYYVTVSGYGWYSGVYNLQITGPEGGDCSCPPGTTLAPDGSCTLCGAGQYRDASSQTCLPCPAGQYSLAGSSGCTPCPGGTYGASPGASSATCSGQCNAGFYCPEGSTSNTQHKCPAGYYGSTTGLSAATCSGQVREIREREDSHSGTHTR